MSVAAGRTQPVVVRCFARCEQDQVIDALKKRQLWPGQPRNVPQRERVTDWELRDMGGALVAIHRRIDPGKRFSWISPDGEAGLDERPAETLPLYLGHRLSTLEYRRREAIIVTEGEKAADALWKLLRVPTVALVCGAASTPTRDVLRAFQGKAVYLWPDHDDVGQGLMQRVGERLTELGIPWRVIAWHDAPPHGDADDFVRGGGDKGALEALKDAAGCAHVPPLGPMEDEVPIAAIYGEHAMVCCCCARMQKGVDVGPDGRCTRCGGEQPERVEEGVFT